MLVVSEKLDHTSSILRNGLTGRSDDFEVDSVGGFGGKGTNLPGGGLTDTDLCLSNPGSLLVRRDSVSDKSRNLELFGRLNVRG